ncbi:hypothetical protein OROMI_000486 [Orobanche minor]
MKPPLELKYSQPSLPTPASHNRAATMSTFPRFVPHTKILSKILNPYRNRAYFIFPNHKRRYSAVPVAVSLSTKSAEEILVVVGAGAAGIYGAIRAKSIAPDLNVVVIEKGKPLSKVKISGGGRCNVTNGHCVDNVVLAGNYPRGNKELRGSFFDMHGPTDTMSWFSDRGVELKTQIDGRVFPITDSSSTIIDCLISEAKKRGGTGNTVTSVSTSAAGKFSVRIEKRSVDYVKHVEADYLMIASGSSEQVVCTVPTVLGTVFGYKLAAQLGHSIVKPVPSLFTFKIDDFQLVELSGVTFPKVRAKLKLETVQKSTPELTQVGPMLVTHWGFSGPVILHFFPKQRVNNSFPTELGIVKRFWRYILEQEVKLNGHSNDLDEDLLWASISNNLLISIASRLKNCSFRVKGKGQFKDEFVTAGGVPLSEVSMNTMQSRVKSRLFFAGEVLNIDGVTGGFNFQNAWSGGYIAGTSIGNLARAIHLNELAV